MANRFVVFWVSTVPEAKLLTVESWTVYSVTLSGLLLFVQVTVIDVKLTAVHVEAAEAGIFANVDVVSYAV